MEIKGTAVRSTPEYIQQYHPERYQEWIDALPDVSQSIFQQPIFANSWYNLTDAVIIPTKIAGDLFFNGNHTQAAKTIGRYSAEVALKGIYKIFVKVSSPHFVLSKASSIFSTYYNPSDISVIEKGNKHCTLELLQFDFNDKLIMHRISGWIEQTLEVTLKTPLTTDIHNEVEGKKIKTRIFIQWE